MLLLFKKFNIKEEHQAWLFLLPFFVLYLTFTLYPIIGAFLMSLQTGTFTRLEFTGISNYIRLFSDKILLQTLINTFLFVIVSTIVYLFFATIFALWAQNPSRRSTIVRICIYIPSILVISVMTNIWGLIFRPHLGVWSYITQGTFLADFNWFRDPALARWTIVLSTLWWSVGVNMLIIIASLRSIPNELYEAASLDGANEFKQFFSITLPNLYPTYRTLIILQTLASFKLFGQPFLLTGGGPDNLTRSVVLYVYDVGFGARNPGYAAAISVMLMAILIIFTTIQIKLLKKTN